MLYSPYLDTVARQDTTVPYGLKVDRTLGPPLESALQHIDVAAQDIDDGHLAELAACESDRIASVAARWLAHVADPDCKAFAGGSQNQGWSCQAEIHPQKMRASHLLDRTSLISQMLSERGAEGSSHCVAHTAELGSHSRTLAC